MLLLSAKPSAESRSFNRLQQKTAFAFANAIFIIKAKKHPEDIHLDLRGRNDLFDIRHDFAWFVKSPRVFEKRLHVLKS